MNERSEEESNAVRGSTGSLEGLCWSPWPCAACNGGLSAFSYLVERIKTSPGVQQVIPEAIARFQIGLLRDWVGKCSHQNKSNLLLPKLAEGSEHIVLLQAEKAKVFKATKLGLYGDSYYLEDGRINQRNSSPLDYLFRLLIWKGIFRSAPMDLGITDADQIVSSQEFITGKLPTQEAIDAFLIASGLQPVRQEYWIWKKSYESFDVWVADTRPDNFIQTDEGLVPIDVRVWITGETNLTDAYTNISL